jgi:hypothetical protein
MRETQGLINQGLNSTADQSYQSISQGTEQSGLLNQPDNSEGLGMAPMSEAIRSKYSKPFHMQQQRQQQKMKLDARNEHFAKVEMAHQLANEEANLNFQKELIKYKQKQAKRAQRMAVINSVLQLGGMVAGTVAGGPGAGTMAGGAAGTMAGQQLASENGG